MKHPLLCCLTSLLVTACAASDPIRGEFPNTQLNPDPVKAYPFTMRIENAPGEFKFIRVSAQYTIANSEECGRIHPMTGMPTGATKNETLVLERVSGVEFKGTVYADRIKDQDYYGRGVCHWSLKGASAVLKATGAYEETRFLHFTDMASLAGGGTHTRYYPKRNYPFAGGGDPSLPKPKDFPAVGEEDPDEYVPALRDALFTIGVAAGKAVS
jgi:hypothetical protein